MRVLVVSPFPLFPPAHGGRVRTLGLATGLARAGATVEVLCPWRPGSAHRSFDHDGVRCHPQHFAANVLPALLGDRLLPPLALLSLQPYSLGPAFRLRQLGRYDVIQFEFCAHAAWMERLRGEAAIVYSAHNVEADFARFHSWPPLLKTIGLRRIASLERRSTEACDLVLACTAADAQRISDLYAPAADIRVIPHGIDEDLRRFDRSGARSRARAAFGFAPGEKVMLFVGGRGRHNTEALRLLSSSVMPRLGAGFRLLVAGECGGTGRGDREDLVAIGYREDLREAYAAADVAVNPVTRGSGASMKIASYLGAGLPIVTTRIGMRGYEQSSERFHVAEIDGFAEAVAACVASEPIGSEDAEKPPAWTEICGELADDYARLLGR